MLEEKQTKNEVVCLFVEKQQKQGTDWVSHGPLLGNKQKKPTNKKEAELQTKRRCKRFQKKLPPAVTWKLEMVIGPFHRNADRFKQEWRQESRTLNLRILHGALKAYYCRYHTDKDTYFRLNVWVAEKKVLASLISNAKIKQKAYESIKKQKANENS